MRAFYVIFTILPAWIIAGYVSYYSLHDPHLWGLSIGVPVLAGIYTLIGLFLIGDMD